MTVRLPAPVEETFSFLADPRNRPRWQSSLRAVEMLDEGPPRVGMRWRDVTLVGARPLLEITTLEAGRCWAERGTWRGVTAELTLRFDAVPGGTVVHADLRVEARGWRAPLSVVLELLAPAAVSRDLRRAGRCLTDAPDNPG